LRKPKEKKANLKRQKKGALVKQKGNRMERKKTGRHRRTQSTLPWLGRGGETFPLLQAKGPKNIQGNISRENLRARKKRTPLKITIEKNEPGARRPTHPDPKRKENGENNGRPVPKKKKHRVPTAPGGKKQVKEESEGPVKKRKEHRGVRGRPQKENKKN